MLAAFWEKAILMVAGRILKRLSGKLKQLSQDEPPRCRMAIFGQKKAGTAVPAFYELKLKLSVKRRKSVSFLENLPKPLLIQIRLLLYRLVYWQK